MKYWKLIVMAMTALTTATHAQNAGNHNPAFSVPETFITGDPYIFIGVDDELVYPTRTPLELKYRKPEVPTEGTTTLEWIVGGDKILSHDTENDLQGAKGGDGAASKAGPWTWEGDKQSEYEGKQIYLQGKSTAESGDTVTLKSSHSEDSSSMHFEKEFTLVPMEIFYVDRDDPKESWDSTGSDTRLEADEPLYSGKDTGDLVSWSIPSSAFPGASFTWSAELEGTSQNTINGPSGTDEIEWKFETPLDWEPGKYKVKCEIADGSNTFQLEVEHDVGVRTDNIIVIGWIDPDLVSLSTSGVQAGLLQVFPVGGLTAANTDNDKLRAGLLLMHFSEEGVSDDFQIALWPLMVGVDFDAFSTADKTYAARWMFKYGANSPPPASFVDADGILDVQKLRSFSSQDDSTDYKLINHFQIKYLVSEEGHNVFENTAGIVDLNKASYLGNTRDAARLWEISGPFDELGLDINDYPPGGAFPGEEGANNEMEAKGGFGYKFCNEGRPDSHGMAALNGLHGPGVDFDIWSSIEFAPDPSLYAQTVSPTTGDALTRDPFPTEFYQGKINTQMYPTYWIYINGMNVVGGVSLRQLQSINPEDLLHNTDKCQ